MFDWSGDSLDKCGESPVSVCVCVLPGTHQRVPPSCHLWSQGSVDNNDIRNSAHETHRGSGGVDVALTAEAVDLRRVAAVADLVAPLENVI